MTKRDLWNKYMTAMVCRGMVKITGINANSTKRDLQSGLECLRASDEDLDAALEFVREHQPNIVRVIEGNGNWKTHEFNRYYIWSTARMLRKEVA